MSRPWRAQTLIAFSISDVEIHALVAAISRRCGITNAQAKRHAAEKRDGPFGFRPRHVGDRMATHPVLADSGVRESNTSFGGGHDGSELDPKGRSVAVAVCLSRQPVASL
jgi:hypothetical protein